jgi:hypothetical protein
MSYDGSAVRFRQSCKCESGVGGSARLSGCVTSVSLDGPAGVFERANPEKIASRLIRMFPYFSVNDWLPLVWAVPPLSVAPAGT